MVRPLLLSVATTFARVLLGALLINHGSSKVFGGMTDMIQHLDSLGWPLATLQAYMAAYTEFLGGVFLVVGLFTRFASFVNIGLFTIIVFIFHGADAFNDQEPGLLFLTLSILVFLLGPGRLSVDWFLFTKTEEQPLV